MKCDFCGCRKAAAWRCRKLWDAARGKDQTLFTCDAHKPDPEKRPASLRHLPFFYDVRPLETQDASRADA